MNIQNVIQMHYKRPEAKTVIIVHPHPKALEQLIQNFQMQGYIVYGFKRVQEANRRILFFEETGVQIAAIVVPKKLWVSNQITYKQFLNHHLPKYRVYDIDNKEYRDTINFKTWRK